MALKLLSYHTHNVVAKALSVTQEQLFDAIHHGRIKELRDLIHGKEVTVEDFKVLDPSGCTCLGKAVELQHIDIVELLIKNGADVNHPDFYGQTALQYVADTDNVEIAKIIIKAGANLDWIDGLSALHIAACKGRTQVAEAMIKAGANINAKDHNHVSVLHCAVANGHYDVVKLLLDAKADVNVTGSRTHRTPLFLAMDVENERMVEILLKHGAKTNIRDDFGMTVLCGACVRNHNAVAMMIIKAGARVNIRDNHGNGPLHYAARNGNINLCKALLAKGARMNELNKYHESPLHQAVKMEYMDIIELLISHGADTSLCDPEDNTTPVWVAVDSIPDPHKFEKVLQMLLLGGATLNTVRNNKSPLWRAIEEGKVAMATILIQYGADVNIEGPHGITVLHKACRLGLEGLVELILHAGICWCNEQWLNTDAYSSGISLHLIQGIYAHGIPMALHKNLGLFTAINAVRFSTESLLHLSRLCIRKSAGSQAYRLLQSLNLPAKLNDFVMLKVL